MPRIRTIKPDAFLSESLSEVPRGTRWTFAGLWTYADDDGRARDDARLIKAALYPLDDSVSLEDVETDLWLLAGIGAIHRYVGPDGRRYLHMPKWHEHQRINRPTASKTPACPNEDSGTCHQASLESSVMPHAGLTEDSRQEGKGREGEQGGEGTLLSDESDHSETPDRFEEFWEAYGNKVGRKKCETAYRVALGKPGVTADLLIASAAAYALWCRETDTYMKNPLTWLHGEHWRDERPARQQAPTRAQQHLALAKQLRVDEQAQMIPFPQIGESR